ncbi:hypothetical protein [Burkholderia thailandensis]|nr:hypothetical protein [Burkholderia thailandensis]
MTVLCAISLFVSWRMRDPSKDGYLRNGSECGPAARRAASGSAPAARRAFCGGAAGNPCRACTRRFARPAKRRLFIARTVIATADKRSGFASLTPRASAPGFAVSTQFKEHRDTRIVFHATFARGRWPSCLPPHGFSPRPPHARPDVFGTFRQDSARDARCEMRDARCAAPRLMRPASGIEATSMPRQCGARDIHIENASLCAPTASLNLNP